MQRRRGFDAERELARRLWDAGFAVVRGPASGSGAKHLFYPDLVAIVRGRIFAFEVKRRSKPETIYVEHAKAARLLEWCERAGAKPLLAVKLPGEWRVAEWGKLARTPSGWKLDRSVLPLLPTLREWIRSALNANLEEWMGGGSAG